MTPRVKDFPLPRFPTTAVTCSLPVESQTCGCRPVTVSANTPSQMPSVSAPPAPSQSPERGLSIGGLTFHSLATIVSHRPPAADTPLRRYGGHRRSHYSA